MVSTASAGASIRYVIDTRASQFTVQGFRQRRDICTLPQPEDRDS